MELGYCIQYNKKGTDLSEEDVALHLNWDDYKEFKKLLDKEYKDYLSV